MNFCQQNLSPQINELYKKIFGKKDEHGEILHKGLHQEIEDQKQSLLDIEKSTTDNFKQLYEEHKNSLAKNKKEIEDLLPGATSAGLASAFHNQKNTYQKEIKKNNRIFYISVLLFFGMILVSLFCPQISESKFFDDIDSDFLKIFVNFLQKLLFLTPPVWTALYSSKKSNELTRLEQEYAHKEAVTKSYIGFQKEVQNIDDNSKDLFQKLLDTAISTIGYNASTTLDKDHKEKIPTFEALEKSSQTFLNTFKK